jgi:hypothetical protein
MIPIAEWDLSQEELTMAALCTLYEDVRDLDCDHCPVGHYCQDIGKAYQRKILEYLIKYDHHAKLMTVEVIMKTKLEEMLKKVEL